VEWKVSRSVIGADRETMRTAIISDIHANLPALEAVLEDIDACGVDRIFCLGDVIGYGPEPRQCLEMSTRFQVNLLGNHEEAVLYDPIGFNPRAKAAVEWTKQQLMSSDVPREENAVLWKHLDSMTELMKRVRFFSPTELLVNPPENTCSCKIASMTPERWRIFSSVSTLPLHLSVTLMSLVFSPPVLDSSHLQRWVGRCRSARKTPSSMLARWGNHAMEILAVVMSSLTGMRSSSGGWNIRSRTRSVDSRELHYRRTWRCVS